jgi:hypothetical protein
LPSFVDRLDQPKIPELKAVGEINHKLIIISDMQFVDLII